MKDEEVKIALQIKIRLRDNRRGADDLVDAAQALS
jgi:hypothetical protein